MTSALIASDPALFSIYSQCLFQEEVQSQFQTRFYELEMEVRDRDDAILDLQSQMFKLEVSMLGVVQKLEFTQDCSWFCRRFLENNAPFSKL